MTILSIEVKIFVSVFLIVFFVPFFTVFMLIPFYYGHTLIDFGRLTSYVSSLFAGLLFLSSVIIAGISVISYKVYQVTKRRRES